MDISFKKRFIEGYGFFRIILGSAALVGLSAGYFFNDIVLAVPKSAKYHIFDQEILGLIFLAVFFRGIFHVVSGAGIVLLKDWGRQWIVVGWPLMILITFGIAHVTAYHWIDAGLIDTSWQAVQWFGVALYIVFIVFDYSVVGNFIGHFEQEQQFSKSPQPTLQSKHVATAFFIAVLSFIILLYLGRPIKQGFHQGFYRASGKKEAPADQVKQLKAVGSQKAAVELPTKSAITLKEGQVLTIERDKQALPALVVNPNVADSQLSTGSVWKKESGESKEGLSSVSVVAWAGAFMIIFGFISLARNILASFHEKGCSLISFVLLGVGFSLWAVFGMMQHAPPLSFASFVAAVTCGFIVFVRMRNDD